MSDDVFRRGETLVPAWLGPEDHPWIEALVEDWARFVGRPTREWSARAAEPLRAAAPAGKRRRVERVLAKLSQDASVAVVPAPSAVRAAVFGAAQRARDAGSFDRAAVLQEIAREAGIPPEEIGQRLYGDLPEERPLTLPTPLPGAFALTRTTNRALAQDLLRSASTVVVEIAGQSRPLLRQISLTRLLCTVRPATDGVVVEISGPFALFRRTTLYGRALASLLPVLRGAERFVLTAHGAREGKPVRIAAGDPVFDDDAPTRRYDSKLEERFAKELAKAAPDWDVVREPEPLAVDGTWIFPDFALVHRRDPARRWLLEIVGFWTAEYLTTKLDRLRRAGRADLILCVDAERDCGAVGEGALPVVRFRKRVDVDAVVRILEGPPPSVRVPVTQRLGASDLFLDFAGRLPAHDGVHGRLARLAVGDRVALVARGGRVFVETAEGPVAALSQRAIAAWSPRLASVRQVRVVEILARDAAASGDAWRSALLVPRWRIPVVEVVSG